MNKTYTVVPSDFKENVLALASKSETSRAAVLQALNDSINNDRKWLDIIINEIEMKTEVLAKIYAST